MASKHAIKTGNTLEVLEADTTSMNPSLPVSWPSSSFDLFCLDNDKAARIIKPAIK